MLSNTYFIHPIKYIISYQQILASHIQSYKILCVFRRRIADELPRVRGEQGGKKQTF